MNIRLVTIGTLVVALATASNLGAYQAPHAHGWMVALDILVLAMSLAWLIYYIWKSHPDQRL